MVNQLVRVLDEKQRRHFVGLLAKQYGYGGIKRMAEITGLHPATISRGQREVEAGQAADGRIRSQGGGRHRLEKKNRGCCRSSMRFYRMRRQAIRCPL